MIKRIINFLILGAALWLGYPQPSLNFDDDILPLARTYASSSSDSATPLKGVRVVITGATAGIGLGLVRTFSKMGASVVALGRSPKKLSALKEEIGDSLTTVQVQLADLASVQKASQDISNQFESVDILINNAGIHYAGHANNGNGPPTTPQNLDLSFGVNYLSHFLLTERIIPLLRNSTFHPTVVQVSSSYHWAVDGSELTTTTNDKPIPLAAIPGRFTRPFWIDPFGSSRAYCNSKLAQIWHARALRRRHLDIQVKSICPCWVGTSIGGTLITLLIGNTGFPSNGYGIKSSLMAALDSSNSQADYYTNSPATEFGHVILPKLFFSPWAYRWYIRDMFFAPFAPLLLTLQKFGPTVEVRTSSPESYDEKRQEDLYQWSYNTVKEYL